MARDDETALRNASKDLRDVCDGLRSLGRKLGAARVEENPRRQIDDRAAATERDLKRSRVDHRLELLGDFLELREARPDLGALALELTDLGFRRRQALLRVAELGVRFREPVALFFCAREL
jgi:hypothetical protein